MNEIQEIDILDKSKLALSSLFKNTLSIQEKEDIFSHDVDGILNVNSIDFQYIILSNPTVGKIQHAKFTFNNIQPLIFVLDYASDELIKFFRKENLFFIDTAGNCFINLPNLNLFVQGRKNILPKTTLKRAFQKTGLKLLFQLLQYPHLASESYRKIADFTKISLASVSYIFDELKNDGFLIEITPQKKRLSNIKQLITKWAISYAEILRPNIHRGYFTAIDENILKIDFQFDENLFIGGEYGACYLNNSLKPDKLIIYTNIRLSELAKKYKIIPVSRSQAKENQIEILEQFWSNDHDYKNNFEIKPSANHQIVDPILIYADLMMSHNYRSIATAEEILNDEIRNKFPQYNF